MSTDTTTPIHEPETVLDRFSHGVLSVDTEWLVGYANEAAADLLGCPRETLLGGILWEVCPALSDSAISIQLRAAAASGDPLTAEGSFDPTGTQLSTCVYPTDDGLTVTLRPVDDEGRATGPERSDVEVQFESLVRGVEEYAIFVLEPDGTVATWNEGAQQIKGYEAEDIVGEHFSTFYTEDDVEAGRPRENLRNAITDGQVVDEGWRVRADGSCFWATVVITPIYVDDTLRGFTKVTRDMTDHREREQRLRRERDFSDRLVESVPVSITVVDADGEIVQQNRRTNELLGDDSGDGTESLLDYEVYDESGDPVPFEDRPYMEVFETGEPVFDWHCQFDVPDGPRWMSLNAIPFFAAGDEVEEVVVACEDITALKEREQELERDRDRLESELTEVFSRVSDAFFALDEDWRFTYVNEQAAELVERTVDELEGEIIWETYPDTVGTGFQETCERAMEQQESVTFEAYYQLLETWFEVNVYPSESGLSVYFDDVTARKERERELEQYETIVETVDDGLYAVDDDGNFVLVNEGFCELTGYDRERLLGAPANLVHDPDIGTRAESITMEMVEGNRATATLEFDVLTESGASVPCEGRLAPYPVGGGHGRCGVVRDITERKARERELERYRTIVETMNDGVYIVDGAGRFTMVNDAYAEMVGHSPEDLLGTHVSTVVDQGTAARAQAAEAEMTAGEASTKVVEAPIERPDGSTIEAEARFVLVHEGDRTERLGVVRDVTERKEYERQLERRVRQQALVADLGRRALEGTPLDHLFDETVEAVADVLGVDYCKVLELVPDAEELLLRSGTGWDEGYVGTATVGTETASQAGYTLEQIGPVVVDDLASESRFTGSPLLTDHDVTSGISVVIGSPSDPWGVLGVHDTESRVFDEHVVSFVQSIANVLETAIDRRAYERALKRYEVFTEESTDVNAILDTDGTIRYATPSVEPVLGYTPEAVVGENVFDIVHPDDRPRAREEVSDLLENPSSTPTMELRLLRRDGDTRVMEISARNLLDDQHVQGLVTYTRDVTGRKERERTLREQRDQLSALVQLNAVVRDINTALVESSSREELERQVCERLASSGSYEYAWVGELDPSRSEFVARTSASPHDVSLEEITVPYVEDGDCGPTCMAVRTGEIQVVNHRSSEQPDCWQDAAERFGFLSSAAIPIVHGERRYGVLNVYSERENAFDERERTVIAQLGETIGHALTALERKEALIADTVTELELHVPGFGRVVTASDAEGPPTISLERTISTGSDTYLLYVSIEGFSATEEEDVSAFFGQGGDTVSGIRHIDEVDGTSLYEVRLENPTFLSILTEYGGSIREVVIREGGLDVRVEVPVERNVRELLGSVQEVFPDASVLRQKQVQRESHSEIEYVSQVAALLTEKQYRALETAYFAGYYDWPRKSSAHEVAEALSVSDATISQHFRSGHRKLCRVLIDR